jgi:hypothetical protein
MPRTAGHVARYRKDRPAEPSGALTRWCLGDEAGGSQVFDSEIVKGGYFQALDFLGSEKIMRQMGGGAERSEEGVSSSGQKKSNRWNFSRRHQCPDLRMPIKTTAHNGYRIPERKALRGMGVCRPKQIMLAFAGHAEASHGDTLTGGSQKTERYMFCMMGQKWDVTVFPSRNIKLSVLIRCLPMVIDSRWTRPIRSIVHNGYPVGWSIKKRKRILRRTLSGDERSCSKVLFRLIAEPVR